MRNEKLVMFSVVAERRGRSAAVREFREIREFRESADIILLNFLKLLKLSLLITNLFCRFPRVVYGSS